MSKVDEVADAKEALLPVDDHPIFSKETEDLTEVRCVLLFSVAGNENIVEVDENKGNAAKDAIHQPLKTWSAFLSPKGMRRNSQSPKGVITAVLGTSANALGIWW